VTDSCGCITCGDVAVLARVIELRGQNAVIELGGAREEVAVELVEPVRLGEQLLCHAGVAIARPQEQRA
jgi:hydrogenase maturation factor